MTPTQTKTETTKDHWTEVDRYLTDLLILPTKLLMRR